MFRQEKISSSVNEIVYQVKYRGREVIGNSRAGLQLDNRTWELALARKINQVKCWMDNLEVDSVIYQPAVNKSWHPLYGERSTVREAYNEAIMYLSKKDGSNYRLNIEVRAYDEGIAFRYFFPEHPQAIFHKVVGDLTEYTFSPGSDGVGRSNGRKRPFEHLAINDIKQPVERALTVELSNGLWVALTDADVDDQGEENVHQHAADHDEQALPGGFAPEFVRLGFALHLFGIHALVYHPASLTYPPKGIQPIP